MLALFPLTIQSLEQWRKRTHPFLLHLVKSNLCRCPFVKIYFLGFHLLIALAGNDLLHAMLALLVLLLLPKNKRNTIIIPHNLLPILCKKMYMQDSTVQRSWATPLFQKCFARKIGNSCSSFFNRVHQWWLLMFNYVFGIKNETIFNFSPEFFHTC